MRINDYIKQKRKDSNISDSKFSEIIEQSIHWVEDFDGDEEELNGLNINQFKNMCLALGVTPEDVFEIVISDLKDLNLFELIKARRKEKYWSVDDLADRIGYEVSVVKALEGGTNLDAVCLDALKGIAVELELPFNMLLQKLEK